MRRLSCLLLTAALLLSSTPELAARRGAPLLRPLPDVHGSLELLSQECRRGARLRCTLRVQFGIASLGAQVRNVRVRFYLSETPGFPSPRSALLREISTGPLRENSGRSLLLDLPLPLGEEGTGKYVIVLLDPANRISESDETNNVIVYGPV